MPPPPPAPPPPTFSVANTAKPNLNNNEAKGRNMLLSSIQGGAKLKSSKHLMVDKSGPSIAGNNNNKSPAGGATASRPLLPGGRGGGSSNLGNREAAQNASTPQLGGLFSGGMPTLRKTGQRPVASASMPANRFPANPVSKAPPPPSKVNTGAAHYNTHSAPKTTSSISAHKTPSSISTATNKKWPKVNTNQSAPQIKSNAKSIAEKFNNIQSNANTAQTLPPPPPLRVPTSVPHSKASQQPPPPPQRNATRSTQQAPPPPQRAVPTINKLHAPKLTGAPPPPPARVPVIKAPPPPPSRTPSISAKSHQPSIQRNPSVNSVNMRNGSATAHPPAPPSRNSRHSTGSRHSATSPGYASSIISYDIDFEKKYQFVDLNKLPSPNEYLPCKKSYPSLHRQNPALTAANSRTRSAPAPPPQPK